MSLRIGRGDCGDLGAEVGKGRRASSAPELFTQFTIISFQGSACRRHGWMFVQS